MIQVSKSIFETGYVVNNKWVIIGFKRGFHCLLKSNIFFGANRFISSQLYSAVKYGVFPLKDR
jgi:hypothetical protein